MSRRGEQLFLVELARSNKRLLCLVLAGLCFAAFSAWTKFEATPLHMWNMFAVPLQEHKTYTVTTLYADEQPVGDPAGWNYFGEMVAAHSSDYYLRLKDGSYIAPEFRSIKRLGAVIGLDMDRAMGQLLPGADAINAYPAWLKRYTEKALGQPVHTLKLVAYEVTYTDSGRLQVISARTLLQQ